MDDRALNIEAMSMIITMLNGIALATENARNNSLELENMIALRLHCATALTHPRDQFTDDLYEDLDLSSAQWSAIDARIRELRRSISSQEEASARIQLTYRTHMVTAPYLEVNSVESAEFARFLYDSCRWRGSVCINYTIDHDLRDTILDITRGITHLFFERSANNEVRFL